MDFTCKSSTWAEACLHDVTRQNVAVGNDHFVYAFVDVNVVSGNVALDVRFCELTPFCIKRINVRNTITFNDFPVFSIILDWNQVRCKNSDHPCVSFH